MHRIAAGSELLFYHAPMLVQLAGEEQMAYTADWQKGRRFADLLDGLGERSFLIPRPPGVLVVLGRGGLKERRPLPSVQSGHLSKGVV